MVRIEKERNRFLGVYFRELRIQKGRMFRNRKKLKLMDRKVEKREGDGEEERKNKNGVKDKGEERN